jgi:hypothetical protein
MNASAWEETSVVGNVGVEGLVVGVSEVMVVLVVSEMVASASKKDPLRNDSGSDSVDVNCSVVVGSPVLNGLGGSGVELDSAALSN